MAWLSAPVSQGHNRWRCTRPLNARSSVSACGPRSNGRRAASPSASRPSDQPPAPPPRPDSDQASPSSHASSVSACSPSRPTKAATALMPPSGASTPRAAPRPASATATASPSTTQPPRWRQRASSAGRPRRWPSSQARASTWAARVGRVWKACRSSAWSSSGPAASMRRTASATTAAASGVRGVES